MAAADLQSQFATDVGPALKTFLSGQLSAGDTRAIAHALRYPATVPADDPSQPPVQNPQAEADFVVAKIFDFLSELHLAGVRELKIEQIDADLRASDEPFSATAPDEVTISAN